jgi:hypothetical protein
MKNLPTQNDREQTVKEIANNLSQFSGTGAYYRYSPLFPFLLLTDGTRYLVEACNCYWLIDLIASMQRDPLIRDYKKLQAIQFWKLTVNAEQSATVTCEWDSEQTVYAQNIEYTDFPLSEARIWIQPYYSSPSDKNKKLVAHLPSEY